MPPELIIFDCDGVLIDSEGIASALIAREMTALGWMMDADEAQRQFIGMCITDMEPVIEAKIGYSLPLGWRAHIEGEMLDALGSQVRPMPGAKPMLEKITRLGIDWRIASNSSDQEMAVKFASSGLAHLTAGRAHSAVSLAARGGRPKPAPDIYLDAASASGIAPKHCLVLEDSALGVTAAVRAGMACYGFAPHGDGAALLTAGATALLSDLDEIFGVLA